MVKVRLLDLAKAYGVSVEWLLLLIENRLSEGLHIDVKLDKEGLVIVCDEKAYKHLIDRIELTKLD